MSKRLGTPLPQLSYLLDAAVTKACTFTLFSLNMHTPAVLKMCVKGKKRGEKKKKGEIFISKALAGGRRSPCIDEAVPGREQAISQAR